MSTTAQKRTFAQAMDDAEAFRDLFPTACYERWEFAGSLRRHRPDVADIEHICIPAFGEIDVGGGLFPQMEQVNLLWHHLDALVKRGTLAKHEYGGDGGLNRWGQLYRGVDFRGFNNEVFCADESNFGATLAIRTGPADFSKRLVTGLLRLGRRNKDGKVWRCEPCPSCRDRRDNLCGMCQGTNLRPVKPIPAPDEWMYFQLAGVPFVEPERRV